MYTAADQLPLSDLAQYGLAGIILSVLLTFGWIVYKRERDRADAERAKVEELQELYRKDSADTRDALRESLRTLADVAAKRRQP